MQLSEFKRIPDTDNFSVKFDDGFSGEVSAKTLREGCPCAECAGEEVLLYKYNPPPKLLNELSFQLEKAQMVGNYAIQLFWKDGHNTGIYKWEYLQKLVSGANSLS